MGFILICCCMVCLLAGFVDIAVLCCIIGYFADLLVYYWILLG